MIDLSNKHEVTRILNQMVNIKYSCFAENIRETVYFFMVVLRLTFNPFITVFVTIFKSLKMLYCIFIKVVTKVSNKKH